MNENNCYLKRIVITGLGCVTSLGIGKDAFWRNLIAGESGISRSTTFDTSSYECHNAGEIKNFIARDFISKKRLVGMGRASQMAVAASSLALEDAGFDLKDFDGTHTGVCIGTTMGEPQVMEDQDLLSLSKTDAIDYDVISSLAYPANVISNNVAYRFHCRADNMVFSTACASGNYAISRAADLIRNGRAQMMLAGGSDALSRIAFTGFHRLLAMAPEKCQPFDLNRKGMMVGEGAGILLLETLESAQSRGAVIYGEVAGYGLSCDAHHMTQPDLDGVSKAMEKAIKNACASVEDVDYICAHGTGTKENDRTESGAIKKVCGAHTSNVFVSSIKSMLGHTMGAASAIEALACCLTLQKGVIPPTINYETPDPDCDCNLVTNKAQQQAVKLILNNAQAFGGNNCCLVLKHASF